VIWCPLQPLLLFSFYEWTQCGRQLQ
jgi:hypothetical protein